MKIESHIKANHGEILLLSCTFYLIISPYISLRILCSHMRCSVFSVPFLLLSCIPGFQLKCTRLTYLKLIFFILSSLSFPCSHVFLDRDKSIRCFHGAKLLSRLIERRGARANGWIEWE